MQCQLTSSGLSPASLHGASRPPAPIVLIIDAGSRIVLATPAARILLKKGGILCDSFGRLGAATQVNALRLTRAIAEVLRRGWGTATFSGGEGRDIEADLAATETDDASIPHIVITVRPGPAEDADRLHAAQSGFGLTKTEARLAAALYEGCSIPQAAHRMGVANSTARTHLQRIFDKTGVRRQADLVRVISAAGQ